MCEAIRASNRLWRALAATLEQREDQPSVMLWAKVRTEAWRGKRHALTTLALTPAEVMAARRAIWGGDSHVQFCLRHEREHNAAFPW